MFVKLFVAVEVFMSRCVRMERQKKKNPKLKINLFFSLGCFENGTFYDPSIVIEIILRVLEWE